MSKVVFVGNIPFEMTEEQIIDIFKEVGPVVSFKLMFDPKTGKPRGYGFCEFMDAETAKSAIRNLNNYDVGGRTINVGPADKEMPSSYHSMAGHSAGMLPPPPKPANPMLQNASFGIESVNATLAALNNQQLSEIIINMKNLAATNPAQANQIFEANPALAYAIFQSLINMKLVDPNTIQELTNQQKYGIAPTMSSQALMQSTSAAAPSIQQQQPPPMMDDPQQVLARILSMTDDEINMLPEQNREQIRLIRKQHLGSTTADSRIINDLLMNTLWLLPFCFRFLLSMQTSIYYQPRLTTKNTGKTWLQYEEIFRSIKSEFQADVIYKEILRLISIILPADQEEALWAINDKASNMSKLFTLVHGPFGNNKQRATDVFNVVPDMQIQLNIFAHIEEIDKVLDPDVGHYKQYEDPSVNLVIPFYVELFKMCSISDLQHEIFKLLDNVHVIRSLIHILVSPDHRERELVTKIIIVLIQHHETLRIPTLQLIKNKMTQIDLVKDNAVISRAAEHLIQIYTIFLGKLPNWRSDDTLIDVTNTAFASLFSVSCLDNFKDMWAAALTRYFAYIEIRYPESCDQVMIDFLDLMLKKTFLPTHSSYSKETSQLDIWAYVILHIPTPVDHLGTVICHFFYAFKNNARTIVVQAFETVAPKLTNGFTTDKFIHRFKTKDDYFEIIGILLECLYSWTNDVHEMSQMNSPRDISVYRHIFPSLLKVFSVTIPLYEEFIAFYQSGSEAPMNRNHIIHLYEKLDPIRKIHQSPNNSSYLDILKEANDRLAREKLEQLSQIQKNSEK